MYKQYSNKIIITAVLFSSFSYAKILSHSDITKMVNNIKKERSGITLTKLDSTSNPFILFVHQEAVKEEIKVVGKIVKKAVVYKLKAIMNHAAFIDENWYKQGDKMGEYSIGYISSFSVILKSSKGNKTLSLKKKTKNLIKINKGTR